MTLGCSTGHRPLFLYRGFRTDHFRLADHAGQVLTEDGRGGGQLYLLLDWFFFWPFLLGLGSTWSMKNISTEMFLQFKNLSYNESGTKRPSFLKALSFVPSSTSAFTETQLSSTSNSNWTHDSVASIFLVYVVFHGWIINNIPLGVTRSHAHLLLNCYVYLNSREELVWFNIYVSIVVVLPPLWLHFAFWRSANEPVDRNRLDLIVSLPYFWIYAGIFEVWKFFVDSQIQWWHLGRNVCYSYLCILRLIDF